MENKKPVKIINTLPTPVVMLCDTNDPNGRRVTYPPDPEFTLRLGNDTGDGRESLKTGDPDFDGFHFRTWPEFYLDWVNQEDDSYTYPPLNPFENLEDVRIVLIVDRVIAAVFGSTLKRMTNGGTICIPHSFGKGDYEFFYVW